MKTLDDVRAADDARIPRPVRVTEIALSFDNIFVLALKLTIAQAIIATPVLILLAILDVI